MLKKAWGKRPCKVSGGVTARHLLDHLLKHAELVGRWRRSPRGWRTRVAAVANLPAIDTLLHEDGAYYHYVMWGNGQTDKQGYVYFIPYDTDREATAKLFELALFQNEN